MTPDRPTDLGRLTITSALALLLLGCQQDRFTKEVTRTPIITPAPNPVPALSPADVATILKYYPQLDQHLFRQAYDLPETAVRTRVLNFTKASFDVSAAAAIYRYFESLHPDFHLSEEPVSGSQILIGPTPTKNNIVFIIPEGQPFPIWPQIDPQVDFYFKTHFDADSSLALSYLRAGPAMLRGVQSIATEDDELATNQGFMMHACESRVTVAASTQQLAAAFRRALCTQDAIPLFFTALNRSYDSYQTKAGQAPVSYLGYTFFIQLIDEESYKHLPQIPLPITRAKVLPPSQPLRK